MKNKTLVELCKVALSIDSSSNTGTTDFMTHVQGLGESLGLSVVKKNYLFRDLDFHNLLMSGAPSPDEIKLLFVNPLDTESPGPFRAWTETDQDPFYTTIKDGRIFGLGANSGKLNTIILMKTLSELPHELRRQVAILGTYGREIRSHGALKFLKENRVAPEEIIVGFPTENKIVTSQAGRFRMRINFPFTEKEKELRELHDEQEHSSSESQYFHPKFKTNNNYKKDKRFWKNNPIGEALSFFENLPDQLLVLDFAGGKDLYSDPRSCLIEFDLVNSKEILMGLRIKNFYRLFRELTDEFAKHRNPHSLPEQPMIHLGRVVCDYEGVEFWGECIFPAGIGEEISGPWIEKLRSEIRNIGGSSKMLSQRWPYIFSGDKNFLNQALQCAGCKEGTTLPYTSEADLFSLAGYNPLIYGPGEFLQMFMPNESVPIEAIEKAQAFYKNLIQSYSEN